MKKSNFVTAFLASLGMLVLILDGKNALLGASDGIDLCIRVLIPSLFPFLVLSALLTGSLSGQSILLLRPLGYLFGIPKGAESLLAVGFLGGYPAGAQNIALSYKNGQLSSEDASRMLAFCNNAGPAFIFGILGAKFSHRYICLLLWLIHILSALLTSLLLPHKRSISASSEIPAKVRVTDALFQSVKAMAQICAWVVLMRTVLYLIEKWFLWALPVPAQVIISGILELSNGCVRLSDIASEGLRFIVASGLLSLGGVCVTLQTITVADKLSCSLYFPGKILQCCISVILSYFLQLSFPYLFSIRNGIVIMISAAVILFMLPVLKYQKKSSSIPSIIGV